MSCPLSAGAAGAGSEPGGGAERVARIYSTQAEVLCLSALSCLLRLLVLLELLCWFSLLDE